MKTLRPVLFAFALAAPSAFAATYYWDQNGTAAGFGTAGGTWNTTGSSTWNLDPLGGNAGTPAGIVSTNTGTADGENFGTATAGLAAGTITVGTVSGGNMTIGAASGLITFNGGSITLGNSKFIVNNSAGIIINSALGGTTNALAKEGTGTLILGTGSTTRTGTFTITGGTLQLGNGGTTGSFNSAMAIVNNAILRFNRTDTLTQGAATNGTGGVISGTGQVIQAGTGTVILKLANTYTGATVIDQGTLAFTTVSPNLTGGLTFGATAGSTNTGALDLTGVAASATFGNLTVQTNSAVANTITVGSGKTLTFSGTALDVGFNATPGTVNKLTIDGSSSGVGSLVVNNAAAVVRIGVGPGADAAVTSSTLDLSTLGSVSLGTIAAPITSLSVGARTTNGTLLLSNTANVITATTLSVGNSNGGNPGGTNILTLGTGTNVLNLDTINIGFSKATATLKFDSQTAGSPGTVTILNKAGATGLAALNIGSQNGTSTGTGLTGTLDLRGHTATVNVGAVNIGRTNQSSTGSANGILRFDTGTFNATSLDLGIKSNSGTGSNNTNAVNIGGGTFTVSGAVAMSEHTGTGATGNVTSKLNITNGTVNLGSTVSVANKNGTGGGVAAGEINVSDGALNVTGLMTLATQASGGTATGLLNITGGVVTSSAGIAGGAGAATSTINLNGAGAILDLTGDDITDVDNITFTDGTLKNLGVVNTGMTLAGTGSRVFDQGNGVSGNIQGAVTGAGIGLTKQGLGTLTLGGANSHTGPTSITAGTLSIASTGLLDNTAVSASNSGSTFAVAAGSGMVSLGNTGTVAAGATLALDSGTIFSMADGTAGGTTSLMQEATFAGNALTLNAATLNFELGGAAADKLAVTGALATASVTGVNTISLTGVAALTAGTYDLITTANPAGGLSTGGTFAFSNGLTSGAVTAPGAAYLVTLNNSANIQSVTVGASAAAMTWTGQTLGNGVTDAGWNTTGSTNFALDTTPVAFNNGNDVTFQDTNTVTAGSVAAPGLAVTIQGGGVSPGSTTFNNSAVNYTVGNASGVIGIAGTGGLTKAGTGTLTLSSANSYTGNTTVNGGVLDVSTDGAQLYSGANPVSAVVTVNTGGVLVVRNFGQANTTGPGSPSLGNLNNTASRVVLDGGTLRFNGETTARGRVLTIGANGGTIEVTNSSNYTMNTSVGGNIPFVGSNNVLTLGGDAGSTGTLQPSIGGTGVSLVKTGASTWSLTSTASAFTGNIDINDGTLRSGAGLNATNPATSPLGNPQTAGRTITIGSSGTLGFGGSDSMGNGTSVPVVKIINNGGVINNAGNFFTTLGPVDLNGGAINAIGGTNTNYGSFQLAGTVTVGGSAASTISASGANSQVGLKSGGTGTTFDVADVTGSSASDLDVSAVLANVNAVAGILTKTGAGTMTLSAANIYTGLTTVAAGTLTLTGNRTVAPTANPGLDVGGTGSPLGTLNLQGDLAMGGSQFRIAANGPGTVNHSSGALSFTGGSQLTLGITAGMAGIYNLSGGSVTTVFVANRGVIIGTNASTVGTLNLSGSGTLTMAPTSVLHIGRSENVAATGAAATFNQTGGTATVGELRMGGSFAVNNANQTALLDVSGGTFTAASFSALSGGDNSASTIKISGAADVTLPAFPTARGSGATATLRFDGGTLRSAAASGAYMSGLTNAFIEDGGVTFAIASGRDIVISQNLLADPASTGGGLTKSEPGFLILTGANTWTGATTVSGGLLQLGNGTATGSLSTASAISVGTGATFAVNQSDTVTQGTDFSGAAITGLGGFQQAGTGATVLNVANGYTGPTTVTAGTLTLAFGGVAADILSASSALTLGGGTLQLTGTGIQTMAGLTTTAGTYSGILLGANQTLTLGALTAAGAGSTLNFNTGAGGANATTPVPGTGIVVLTGQTAGTPMNSGFTVSDAGGFGLATVDGSDRVIRLVGGTLLPASGAASATDYRVDNNAGGVAADGSSSLVVTAFQSTKSITVDTTTASGVLTLDPGVVLGNNTWNFGGTGANTYQITGGTGLSSVAANDPIGINNFNAGIVTLASPILANGANDVIVAGTGTTVFSGANTHTGSTTIAGGTLNANASAALGDGSATNTLIFNGGTLQAGGAITSPATRGVTLTGNGVIDTNSNDVTLDGLIGGAGGLTKAGAGTLTLTGANTYAGGTVINAGSGTLQATITQAANALGTGAVSVGSGSTLVLDNQSITNVANVPLINNVFTGAGLLKLQFAANATARSSFMPNVTGFAGTIQLSNLGATGDKWTASNLGTISGSLLLDSGNTIFVGSGTTSFTGGITLNGGGSTENRGAIRVAGATTVVGGNISLASSSTISMENAAAQVTGDITSGVAGAHTLTLGGTGSTAGILSGNISDGTGAITITQAVGSYTLSGNLSHTGGVNVAAGLLTLSGANNTYSGVTAISATAGRSLLVTANGALGATGAGNETTVGVNGQLGFSGGINYSAAEKVIGSGAGNTSAQGVFAAANRGFIQSVSGSNTFAGDIELSADGTSRIGTQTGAQLTLTGAITQGTGITTANLLFRVGDNAGDFVTLSNAGNSFGGDSTVFTGAGAGNYAGLRLGVSNALPTNLTLSGFSGTGAGTALDLNGKNQTLNGLINGASLNLVNLDTGNVSTLTLNPTADKTTTNTVIAGGGGLGTIHVVKDGPFAQTLAGLNSFTGGVTVDNGTLVAGVAGSGGSSALGGVSNSRTITVNPTGTLRFDVGNVFNNNFGSAASALPVLNIAGGTLTNGGTATNSALGDITLAGGTLDAVGGTGSSSGYGVWNLNGTVTSTGTSTLSSVSARPVTLSASSANSFITTFDVQSGTLTASAELGQVTATGDERISGLTKTGDGTLILSGANSYTGDTLVSDGTLLINGTQTGGGMITVSGTATLGGSGTMGNVTIAGDGILAPGNSAGQIMVGGLTLNDTSVLAFELGAPNMGQNPASDHIQVNGNLTLSGKLQVTGLGGFPGVPNDGDTWLLMSYTGILADNTLVVDSAPSGKNYVIDTATTGSVFLTAVPEAGTAGLLALGLLLLRRLRRR